MADFLLELFSEEIPARMQARAASDLKQLVAAKLTEGGLKFQSADAYVTPRRLCLHIVGLDDEQPDTREERRGPRADAPEKAIEGFLKGANVTQKQVEIREEAKGTFLYAIIEKKGRKTTELLTEFLPDMIRNFPWPKSQRWGSGTLRWVRPMHSILCLLDDRIVAFDLGDNLMSGNQTRGHRFLSPDSFTVSSFEDYKDNLAKAHVILEPEMRKKLIHDKAHLLAKDAELSLVEDEGLLDEIVGLAEYPVVMMGEFDKDFLDVPNEALMSAMKSHQKYFSLMDKNGKLAHKFIFVANMKTTDQGKKIIAGNERVLRARLSDTKFFWDQDLKISLDDRLPALNDIVFHEKLGTVGQRVERLAKLSGYIADKIGADVTQAKRAALLCKADLVSGMVGEFADLQGLMGKYYAEKQGESEIVANAIVEHYSPKGPSDSCPTNPVSVVVALAEKLDSLVGFFGIDEKPTGSKDPFALRRAALGIIRLVVENKLRLNLLSLFAYADEALSLRGDKMTDLLDFFADRLKVHLKEQGVRHDLITAVFSLGGEDDLVRMLARVEALQNFLTTDEGTNLLAGYKRAANILKAEEKKDGPITGDATMGNLPEEQELFKTLNGLKAKLDNILSQEKFEDAMSHLAKLRPAIDAFFDKVTVNSDVDTERKNRLRLLADIRNTMHKVADFSKIEG